MDKAKWRPNKYNRVVGISTNKQMNTNEWAQMGMNKHDQVVGISANKHKLSGHKQLQTEAIHMKAKQVWLNSGDQPKWVQMEAKWRPSGCDQVVGISTTCKWAGTNEQGLAGTSGDKHRDEHNHKQVSRGTGTSRGSSSSGNNSSNHLHLEWGLSWAQAFNKGWCYILEFW